jgi:hypothetical protein
MKGVPEREDELDALKTEYFKKMQNIYILIQAHRQDPDGQSITELDKILIFSEFHKAGVEYFNAFERTVDEYGLSSIELNVDTKNRKSEDAINMVQPICDHWSTVIEYCKVFALPPPTVSITSYASIQRVIKKFHPAEVNDLKAHFKEVNLPVHGFESNAEHSGWKKSNVKLQLWIGVPLLAVCGILTFVFPSITGMQYLFLRFLLALSVSMVGSAFLQGFANLSWSVQKSFTFTASGSVAIFVLLTYFNPPSPPTL